MTTDIESKAPEIILEYLTEIREAAQESLNSLLQIKNLIQPNILKDKEVNEFLEKDGSVQFKNTTEEEIAYFISVLAAIDKKIEEQENKVENNTTSTKEETSICA